MTDPLTLSRVQSIVGEIAGADRCPPDAGPDTPLGPGGFWLDSVALVEVVIACEAAFGVVFDPETDFTEGSLASVRTLASVVQARRPR